MDKRSAQQLDRVVASIQRLTFGTPFEGTRVLRRNSTHKDRLRFDVITPKSDHLLDSYHGVLIPALEGWTDESLDRRLYESASTPVRHLLNKPGGEEPGPIDQPRELQDADVSSRYLSEYQVLACPECQEIFREIKMHLTCLRETAKMGSNLSRDLTFGGLGEFTDLLTQYLQLREEVEHLGARLAIHRRSSHVS
jgi:hypothetical protein